MFPCFVAHSLDVGLCGAHVEERVIDRFCEFLRLDRNSPLVGTGNAASIATEDIPARA